MQLFLVFDARIKVNVTEGSDLKQHTPQIHDRKV